jgi:thiamine-phosphate diphosphorylase/hydroxyethylthiazole kinase
MSPLQCEFRINLSDAYLRAYHLRSGASPIMTDYGGEAEDLAKLNSALVINLGINSPDIVQNFTQALNSYNKHGSPVLFDPVGAGATQNRQRASKTIMATDHIDVIKGNEDEISFLLGDRVVEQRGVDSALSGRSEIELATTTKQLAKRESMSIRYYCRCSTVLLITM